MEIKPGQRWVEAKVREISQYLEVQLHLGGWHRPSGLHAREALAKGIIILEMWRGDERILIEFTDVELTDVEATTEIQARIVTRIMDRLRSKGK